MFLLEKTQVKPAGIINGAKACKWQAGHCFSATCVDSLTCPQRTSFGENCCIVKSGCTWNSATNQCTGIPACIVTDDHNEKGNCTLTSGTYADKTNIPGECKLGYGNNLKSNHIAHSGIYGNYINVVQQVCSYSCSGGVIIGSDKCKKQCDLSVIGGSVSLQRGTNCESLPDRTKYGWWDCERDFSKCTPNRLEGECKTGYDGYCSVFCNEGSWIANSSHRRCISIDSAGCKGANGYSGCNSIPDLSHSSSINTSWTNIGCVNGYSGKCLAYCNRRKLSVHNNCYLECSGEHPEGSTKCQSITMRNIDYYKSLPCKLGYKGRCIYTCRDDGILRGYSTCKPL